METINPTRTNSLTEARPAHIINFFIIKPHVTIAIVLLVTILALTQFPKIRFRTSIYDLAILDLPQTLYYQTFSEQFGHDEIILVVIKAKTIFEKETFAKIRHLTESLSKIKGVGRVLSLSNIKKEMDLTERWGLADYQKILKSIDLFDRNFISPDHKTTAISIIIKDASQKDAIIDQVQKIIDGVKGNLSIYQIGMPVVAKALATYTEKDFLTLPPITYLVIILVLWFLFRNLTGVLVPASSVAISLIWTAGLMAATNTPLSLMTMIVPVFLIAVCTAYCLYIVSTFNDCAKQADSSRTAVLACYAQVSLPTILAVMTTTIGLGSLLVNKITGIKEFASFSCIGLACQLIIVFTYFPALLSILPLPRTKPQTLVRSKKYLNRLLSGIIRLNLRYQKYSLSILAIITIWAIAGIFFIHVETNPVGYFKKNTPVRQRFHDIYKDLSGSFPINVVLESKSEGYFENPQNLKKIETIQKFITSIQGVDKTVAYTDFLKLVNYSTNQYQAKYYALPEEAFEVRMLTNSYKTMLGQDMLDRFMNPEFSKANIMLRTRIESSKDFLRVARQIKAYLAQHYKHDFTYHVTGFGMVISYSSEILTHSQLKSLSITLVLIFGVMLMLFLSAKVGLIAIIANIFPIIINFGIMGWFGIELSMVTSLIASIAIGLAVDDTIHYLARYNAEFKKDLDKDRALEATISHVGIPIIFTTLTISLGFSILMFSHFRPTGIFGFLMVITMFAALIGDLIILPSLMLHVELITAWDLIKFMPTFGGVSAGIAHEINQPLTAIKMGSEFLTLMISQKQKIPPEQLKEVVNQIGDQVDRAAAIIHRLSTFGEQDQFQKEPINVNDPIVETVNILRHQARTEGIRVNTNLSPSLPSVLAHKNRLGQMMYNLILNAIESLIEQRSDKTFIQGQEEIKVSTSYDQNQVIICVSDTGSGIPAHIIDRIYEPFFSTKGHGHGKGLGLAIVNEIIRDCNGKIEVNSKVNEGTLFAVSFPTLV